jgi:hypothetical protein
MQLSDTTNPDDIDMDFEACETCAAKPGAPLLCKACVHNRDLIVFLKREINCYKAADIKRQIRNLTRELAAIETEDTSSSE